MDVSTFVLGTALTVLPIVAAALLATMVLLEWRAEPLASAPAHAGRARSRARSQLRKPRRARRG